MCLGPGTPSLWQDRKSKDRYIDSRVTLVGGGRGRQMALVLGQAKSQGAMDGR